MYKLLPLGYGQTEDSCVLNLTNNDLIPFLEGNTEYQEYLAWLAEGNEPLPADEQQIGSFVL